MLQAYQHAVWHGQVLILDGLTRGLWLAVGLLVVGLVGGAAHARQAGRP